MRKLSCKWPVWLTLFAVAPPVFYVFFRIGKPESFNASEFDIKVGGAIFFPIIIWLVYGIACLFARSWVNCGKCEFSDIIQGSEEIKCRLTGYNYPVTYSCKKSKTKGVAGTIDNKTTNYQEHAVSKEDTVGGHL